MSEYPGDAFRLAYLLFSPQAFTPPSRVIDKPVYLGKGGLKSQVTWGVPRAGTRRYRYTMMSTMSIPPKLSFLAPLFSSSHSNITNSKNCLKSISKIYSTTKSHQ
jgi:hypothetical protein